MQSVPYYIMPNVNFSFYPELHAVSPLLYHAKCEL